MKISIHEEAGALIVAGVFTIYEMEPAYRAISDYVSSHSNLLINLKGVEDCDAAGAQLLLSLRQSAITGAKSLQFQNASAAVQECWSRLGLPSQLLENPACQP